MALKVWLPLDGNLKNNGYADIAVTGENLTVDNTGKIGKAYSFNGTSSYIQLTPAPFDDSATEYSFACWMKPADYNQSMCLFNNRTAGTGGGFFVLLGSGQYYFDTGGRWMYPAEYPTAGEWTHLAITWKSGGLKRFYLNGTLVEDVNSGSDPTSVANAASAYIGKSQVGSTTNYFFKGSLNDIRIYDHELSAAEVREIARGLVLHYKLDDILPNPNLLFDTNAPSLTKVYGPANRYYESASKGTYTNTFEQIQDPPVPGIKYGIRENVQVVGGAHHSLTFYSGNMSVTIGNTYTMSCYVKNTSGTSGMELFFQHGKNPYRATSLTVANNNKWNQYSWTFVPDDAADADGITRIYCGGLGSVGEVLICGWKLEEGTTATPWVPNVAEPAYGMLTASGVCDSSGYGRHGTIYGTATIDDSPRYSSGAKMNANGTTNHIEGPALPSETKTISMWIKHPFNDNFVAFADPGSQIIFGYIKSTKSVCVKFSTSKMATYSIEGLTVNGWNHAVITKNGSQYALWFNGQQTETDIDNYYLHQGDKMYLFNRNYDASYGMNGSISDFRAYATILSQNDIKALYQTGAKIDKNGSVHGYSFEENSGNMFDVNMLYPSAGTVEIEYIPNGVKLVSTNAGTYRNARTLNDTIVFRDGVTYQISAHVKHINGHACAAIRKQSNNVIIAHGGTITDERDIVFTYTHDEAVPVYFSLFVTMSTSEDGEAEFTDILITEQNDQNISISRTGRVKGNHLFEADKAKAEKNNCLYAKDFVEM